MRLRDLLPRRWGHFGTENYTFIRWLGRDWFRRPFHGGLREWVLDEPNRETKP